jgi:hypothetical protein
MDTRALQAGDQAVRAVPNRLAKTSLASETTSVARDADQQSKDLNVWANDIALFRKSVIYFGALVKTLGTPQLEKTSSSRENQMRYELLITYWKVAFGHA